MAKRLLVLFAAILCVGVFVLFWFFGGVTTFAAKTVTGNPAVGFAPMAAEPDATAGEQLVYVNLTWAEWEPVEGQYAYDAVAEAYHFADYRAAGKHLVLRFVCDVPAGEKHLDLPEWLYEATGDGEYYATDYGQGYCPDYANETLIAAHDRAIRALGAWLSEDNFLLYVELGSLGHWGEWHTKYRDGLPRLPAADVCRRYVQPYTEAFTTAKLLMRRPFAFVEEYGMGVYNDMTGAPDDTAAWLGWLENGGVYEQPTAPEPLAALPGLWRTAPVGGEFTSSIPMERMLGADLPATLAMLRQSHASFLGPKCPQPDHGYPDAAIQAVREALGYQYRVARLQKRGDTFLLSWVNDGVAPLYWDWPVSLCALDADGRVLAEVPVGICLSDLTPGKTVKTATTLPRTPGAVQVAVAVRDPLTGAPALRLAMDCETVAGMSVVYGG